VQVIPYTSAMFHPRLFHANDGLDEIVEGLRPYAGYVSFGDMYVHNPFCSPYLILGCFRSGRIQVAVVVAGSVYQCT
jgi:hypothetical protein